MIRLLTKQMFLIFFIIGINQLHASSMNNNPDMLPLNPPLPNLVHEIELMEFVFQAIRDKYELPLQASESSEQK